MVVDFDFRKTLLKECFVWVALDFNIERLLFIMRKALDLSKKSS